MNAFELIVTAALALGLIVLILWPVRRVKAERTRPGWHDRFEPGWTQAYAAADGLIYGHEELDSLARPSRAQLADLASVGMGEWGEGGAVNPMADPAARLRDW